MKYIFLTEQFYKDYADCLEIEKKQGRPYVQVQVEIDGVKYAIPLRSNINHPNVLWTDKENHCGLDLSKTVVIEKEVYIDKLKRPHIRPNEFKELLGKELFIKNKLQKYIKDYKKAKKNMKVKRNYYLCQYSTLKYFEKYL